MTSCRKPPCRASGATKLAIAALNRPCAGPHKGHGDGPRRPRQAGRALPPAHKATWPLLRSNTEGTSGSDTARISNTSLLPYTWRGSPSWCGGTCRPTKRGVSGKGEIRQVSGPNVTSTLLVRVPAGFSGQRNSLWPAPMQLAKPSQIQASCQLLKSLAPRPARPIWMSILAGNGAARPGPNQRDRCPPTAARFCRVPLHP